MCTFCVVILSESAKAQDNKVKNNEASDSTVVFKDGTYMGISRAKYIYEPFWGIVRFTYKSGVYSDISFMIRDSSIHETFDGSYEKHFTGNDEYIQQSRNDWKGVQTYPRILSEKQDINKVDATSGATWSYNIFKASVNEALKNTK